jgi:hypothetical protein
MIGNAMSIMTMNGNKMVLSNLLKEQSRGAIFGIAASNMQIPRTTGS